MIFSNLDKKISVAKINSKFFMFRKFFKSRNFLKDSNFNYNIKKPAKNIAGKINIFLSGFERIQFLFNRVCRLFEFLVLNIFLQDNQYRFLCVDYYVL